MTAKRKGEGTKFQIDRKLFTSKIWLSGSPWLLRLWLYLIGNANIQDNEWKGIVIKRGQLVRSYRVIAQDISYDKGYAHMEPSISTISGLFKKLVKLESLKRSPLPYLKNKDKKSKLRPEGTGYLITLLNYNILQSFSSNVSNINRTDIRMNKTILSLFEFWNSLKLIEHKKIDKFAPSLRNALKDYLGTQVRKAMVNYATVVKDDKYFFSYRWTLKEFLTRVNGLEKFLDINTPLENFLVDKDSGKERAEVKYEDKT